MKRKVVLVYSRSPLARDERVQRQIRLCSSEYDVVSVGLGPYDGPVIRHIDLATIVPTNTGRATDIPGAGEDVLTSRDNACESSGDELEHPEGLASLDPPGDEFLPASVMSPSQILKMSSAVLQIGRAHV